MRNQSSIKDRGKKEDWIEKISPELKRFKERNPSSANTELLTDEEMDPSSPHEEYTPQADEDDIVGIISDPLMLGEPAEPIDKTPILVKLKSTDIVRLHNECKKMSAIYDITKFSVSNPKNGSVYVFSTSNLSQHEQYRKYINCDGHGWLNQDSEPLINPVNEKSLANALNFTGMQARNRKI